MKYYFTSDQHYGHANAIKLTGRPWKWEWEMSEALISNHNGIVTDQDIVYHLGDFAWKKPPSDYICRLKGKEHHLILGNHDRVERCRGLFTSISDVKMLNINGIPPFFLSHYAHRVWPASHRGSIHLFGHSHGSLRIDPEVKCCDVGVDAWNFFPVSIDEVVRYIKTLDTPKRK